MQKQEITACAFLYNCQGQLFITKRSGGKSFLPNHWELPGGHTEFGECLEKSLIREIKEEFEIDIVIGDLVYAFTYTYQNNSIHAVEVVFFARLRDENQKIILHEKDHSEYRWIDQDEINRYFSPDDEENKAAVKGFQLLTKRLTR
jgi:8-oxo-dGTP diphosphatase